MGLCSDSLFRSLLNGKVAPNDTTLQANLSFNGVAVYVYGILILNPGFDTYAFQNTNVHVYDFEKQGRYHILYRQR